MQSVYRYTVNYSRSVIYVYLNIQRGAFIDWWYIMQFLFLFIAILQQCDKILNEKRSNTRELAEQNTKYNRMGSELFFKKAAFKTRLFCYIDSVHTIASL